MWLHTRWLTSLCTLALLPISKAVELKIDTPTFLGQTTVIRWSFSGNETTSEPFYLAVRFLGSTGSEERSLQMLLYVRAHRRRQTGTQVVIFPDVGLYEVIPIRADVIDLSNLSFGSGELDTVPVGESQHVDVQANGDLDKTLRETTTTDQTPPTAPTTRTSSTNGSASLSASDRSAVIAGSVIGSLCAIAICIILVVFVRRRRHSDDYQEDDNLKRCSFKKVRLPFRQLSARSKSRSRQDGDFVIDEDVEGKYPSAPSPIPQTAQAWTSTSPPQLPFLSPLSPELQLVAPAPLVPAKSKKKKSKRSSIAKERFEPLSDEQMELQEEIHALQAHRIALEFDEVQQGSTAETEEVKKKIDRLTMLLKSPKVSRRTMTPTEESQ